MQKDVQKANHSIRKCDTGAMITEESVGALRVMLIRPVRGAIIGRVFVSRGGRGGGRIPVSVVVVMRWSGRGAGSGRLGVVLRFERVLTHKVLVVRARVLADLVRLHLALVVLLQYPARHCTVHNVNLLFASPPC